MLFKTSPIEGSIKTTRRTDQKTILHYTIIALLLLQTILFDAAWNPLLSARSLWDGFRNDSNRLCHQMNLCAGLFKTAIRYICLVVNIFTLWFTDNRVICANREVLGTTVYCEVAWQSTGDTGLAL